MFTHESLGQTALSFGYDPWSRIIYNSYKQNKDITMVWNAPLLVKCNDNLNDMHWEAIKQWGWEERLYTTSG